MKYEKPEVALVNSAISAIQHPAGSKLGGPYDNQPIDTTFVTVAAYAADE